MKQFVVNQTLHIRIIKKDGTPLLIENAEYHECDSILYESELSTYELLNDVQVANQSEVFGSFQLKKDLEQSDFTIVEIKPNSIPQCVVVKNVPSIKICGTQKTIALKEAIDSELSSQEKGLLFARNTKIGDRDQYVVDILMFE